MDSSKGFYGIRFHRLASSEIQFSDNSFFLILHIAGWEKRFDLLKQASLQSKKLNKKVIKKRRALSFNKIISVIRSFKIEKFVFSVDTGNMPVNGILFPLFFWLGESSKKQISINFYDENVLKLRVENNLARMIRAYIRS
jgi:hypothetical protein